MSNDMTINDIRIFAKEFYDSKQFPGLSNTAQAFVKVQAGLELGIRPFASQTAIHVVQGKPCLSASAMAGLIKASGKYNYKVIERTDVKSEVEFLEKIEKEWVTLGNTSFTMEDAKRAGLIKEGGPWLKFPRNMCFARALSEGFRTFTPDLALGMPVYSFEHGESEVPEPINITPQNVKNAPRNDSQPRRGAAKVDAAPIDSTHPETPVATNLDRATWIKTNPALKTHGNTQDPALKAAIQALQAMTIETLVKFIEVNWNERAEKWFKSGRELTPGVLIAFWDKAYKHVNSENHKAELDKLAEKVGE